MHEEPREIAIEQISGNECIMKFYDDMVYEIPQNTVYGHEINSNPIVYIGALNFEIRTWAVRHVIRTRGNSHLNKSYLHQVGDPIKRHTYLFKYRYIIVV